LTIALFVATLIYVIFTKKKLDQNYFIIQYQSHIRWPWKEFWKIKDDKKVFVGNKKVFKKYLYSDE